ncbi:SDR family NAD(P)-dependent oxidoreductase [Cellulomonas fimi]|uniref:Short-chain dehydrogenase/reductase SDR n=1 Tax=Cellulomonas fimi (strain ATCC 484 / DSM 20113 / JCM 1341 / CCUG 24087 / LMG 16345 / NBRC 15513 / NCIMB 8980 / NCTC 7547 / NRS-133) TaxID=590998 RepID=F4H0K5_CELFA|nr:SDR family oxidoreductase [Cellulomonas fimi]AEE47374.1 short-chain dehydrogenase/reductase SDR [Cellulomonas fimi ATCC 484]NNH05796.1 SDR family oxidoreductase [Cellulomonas fimi]VEH36051.1 Serine 3-dehydrogenase [Cellulomonas fimi]
MGTALVTGASAGLGLEFAWQLATAKHDVVLVARDEERLTRLAAQLEAAAGVHAEVLVADLTRDEDVARVAERLRDPERPVGLLVNNAGLGLGKPFVGNDIDAEVKALDVMVRAVLVLSHAAAGAMVERGRGAILNVGSIAALMASGTYSAHKAWVRSFTESLAVELKGTGVTATVVNPGFTHTEFHERGQIDMSSFPELVWLNAEDVVAAALADVRRGVVISTPSARYRTVSAIVRTLPRSAVRRIGKYRRPMDETAAPDA